MLFEFKILYDKWNTSFHDVGVWPFYELIWTFHLFDHSYSYLTRQDGRHFPNDILKWIFLNENLWLLIKISLKLLPLSLMNNISALVQIMAWCPPGDKPLSKPMMVSLLTHIRLTRPQWVKGNDTLQNRCFHSKKCFYHRVQDSSQSAPMESWVNQAEW